MTRRNLRRFLPVLIAIVAVAAVPATAPAAKRGANAKRTATVKRAPAVKRAPKPKLVTHTIKADVVAVDPFAKTADVTVVKVNAAGRILRNQPLVLDLSSARLKYTDEVTDGNGDGVVDLGDLVAGDRADFRLRLPGRLTAVPTAPLKPLMAQFKRLAPPVVEPAPEPVA